MPTPYRSTLRFVLEGVEGVVILLFVLGTWPLSRRRLGNWGSTVSERERVWPGDALAPAAIETYTRAVDVAASSDVVWRWVVQFGLERAGFYSYELLERLVGIPVRNVEVILPAHQTLEVGAEIKLHPTAPGIPVGVVEEGRHICFGESSLSPNAAAPDPRRSWSIYLEPQSHDSCRLLLRSCIEPVRRPTFGNRFGLALEAPVDFVMEQRMLRTIRRLAAASRDVSSHADRCAVPGTS